MRQYIIRRAAAPLPALTGRAFDPGAEPFCGGGYAPIDQYVWPGEYRPEARAYAAWDDAGLSVLLCANEPSVIATARDFGGKVWVDSCLECFLQPFGDDPRYLNIETNAAGTALIGFGAGRDRRFLAECPPDMDFRASRHEGGWWAVAYRVPFALIERLYGRRPGPGARMRGNFYACDETIHPHFGSWNPIVSPQPDFHRPECFGEIQLACEDAQASQ